MKKIIVMSLLLCSIVSFGFESKIIGFVEPYFITNHKLYDKKMVVIVGENENIYMSGYGANKLDVIGKIQKQHIKAIEDLLKKGLKWGEIAKKNKITNSKKLGSF